MDEWIFVVSIRWRAYSNIGEWAQKIWGCTAFKCIPEVSKTLKRNGLRGAFRGLREVDVIKNLLNEPIYETLWKQKDIDLLKRFPNDGRIKKYWKQILKFKRTWYKVKNISLWLDYLDLLSYFGKDINNPHYLFPSDFTKAHDRFVKKKRAVQEREWKEARERRELQRLNALNERLNEFIKAKRQILRHNIQQREYRRDCTKQLWRLQARRRHAPSLRIQ